MTDVFIKKGNLDTDMDIRRMPYEGEAETKPRDTKDCQQSLEVRKRQGRTFLWDHQRGHGSANALISDF